MRVRATARARGLVRVRKGGVTMDQSTLAALALRNAEHAARNVAEHGEGAMLGPGPTRLLLAELDRLRAELDAREAHELDAERKRDLSGIRYGGLGGERRWLA